MSQPSTRRRTSRSKDVNPRLGCTPLHIAEAYARMAFRGYPCQERILKSIRHMRKCPAEGYSKLESALEFEGETNLGDFHKSRQLLAFLKKVPFPGTADSAKRAAIENWYACEEKCRTFKSVAQEPWFVSVRNRIRRVIGEFTHQKYERILELARYGPGMTLGTRDRLRTGPGHKSLRDFTEPSCTPKAAGIAADIYRLSPARIFRELTLLDGEKRCYAIKLSSANRAAFVPKTFKTHRAIAIEPSLNLEVQLGVHEYWSGLFIRHGVATLNDQSRNQLLARLASYFPGSLATVDLRNASDTLCYQLVKELLPESWFEFLECIRCEFTLIEGETVRLSKFSSMGNGFTFALETLIFWALAVEAGATDPRTLAVYGDDVVLPSHCYDRVVELFERCGFSVNTEKSFSSGPFYESCGHDYYEGNFVTPVYLRRNVIDTMRANYLLNTMPSTSDFSEVRELLFEQLRATNSLYYGLENESPESCVFTTFDYAKGIGALKYHKGYQSWRFVGIVQQGVPDDLSSDASILQSLYSGGVGRASLRGKTRVRKSWLTAGRRM